MKQSATPRAAAQRRPDADPAQAFGEHVGAAVDAFARLNLPIQELSQLQSEYLKEASRIWNTAVSQPGQPVAVADRRFTASDWADNPAASYTAAMYLLNARTMLKMADSVQGDEKTRQRIRFAVQQWLDASAPSNFLACNPEVLRKALETKGESIAQGVLHLLNDLQQGHMSQTDESVFEVGRNMATTEGSVIFENQLFQLIEYRPLTRQVYERPLLVVPPCINKFYILDLQPENSFIRHAVEQGQRVFLVSWRNADESMAQIGWDEYIDDGVIRAIRVVQEVAKAKQISTLGFCIGGTLLGTALAVLAARGEQPAASLTLLTSFLDFANTGVIDLFIDEAAVQMREMAIGPNSPMKGGLLRGSELATTFSFLRPNDLVWNYVVGNYLKGETPPPFDLLYWNSDSTNLPGPMFCWYLRNTYLENNLKEPGKTVVCGEPVDFGRIEAPAFIYGSRDDHIVPWDAAYASTRLLKGKKRFVLGASGHIAGVINPPAKKKRSYWTHAKLPARAQEWLAGAVEHPGSWWPEWTEWIKNHSGKQIAAPRAPGNRIHQAIEPAPGRYVKQKA
ncbi:class I poly(R)-hydroxyalkanoic acid synthase [Schlegelella sp. S2-27]|uniref:Class I poly(R)-hydroxyalkanoic acid synthase n=1 Tax=Caldimonas mangrovi TaxID=2944811 RepID=A0ABT0YTE6_9BURK|nr:class I poly(R)-hydroxyalkanoic acid synthase [Caldimonas mangrovi]MCM5682026.1 class I poly(R)-hydroxyalkanoic acid synthase [Caldimonas mangrovi]